MIGCIGWPVAPDLDVICTDVVYTRFVLGTQRTPKESKGIHDSRSSGPRDLNPSQLHAFWPPDLRIQ